ncbi:hypothetical protein GXM_01092 [Nostoc sphaeroides CCNUC1]|uniref:Uncharacterized protein n=1 Tax=Nostoc sphaeroides CCNUC1 TaxID=2653204 RepID=A0A5P8VUL7_9NOSO|nr:hypothetical protein GXM_01092 [Nostoc sphaeroides CCNUC1]
MLSDSDRTHYSISRILNISLGTPDWVRKNSATWVNQVCEVTFCKKRDSSTREY